MTTPAPRERTGACLCGRIKYRVLGESVYDTFCHCIPCRKWTGSVAFTAAICPKEVSRWCAWRTSRTRRKDKKETQPNRNPTSFAKRMTCSLSLPHDGESQIPTSRRAQFPIHRPWDSTISIPNSHPKIYPNPR
jgi:hypothetical protein